MSTISNSTPIIHLARVDQLDLLRAVFERVLAPPAVIHEVAPRTPALGQAIAAGWIIETPVVNSAKVEELVQRLGGAGEAEAIALGLEHPDSLVLVDERAARIVCQELGLRTRGTLGVLLEAKAAGHVAAVRPIVDALVARGFWLDAATRDRLLALAGESAG